MWTNNIHDFYQREHEQEQFEIRNDLGHNSILVKCEVEEPALDLLADDKEMEE